MRGAAGGRWYLWLALISLAGFAPPFIWILTLKVHAGPIGDAFYFHEQAALIANGTGWFIEPLLYLKNHTFAPSASHPPLWTLVLAFEDTIGLKSDRSQLFAACFIGSGAIFMIGLAAKEVAGRRAGLIAAVIAAIYPNFWINAGLGLSETLILLLIAAVVLVSFKLWRRPDTRTAVTLGLLCGLAALTRAEQSLLLVVLLVPLTLLLRQVGLRRRLWFATTGVVAAIVLMAPWVGFNLSRFSHATFLSNDSGTTLAMANCRAAYSGPYLGYGDFFCLDAIKPVPGDESAQDAHYRRRALRYVKTHLSRLPIVLIARPAREFGFFAPVAQLKLEAKINGRPLILAEIGLGMYYVMLVTGLLGAVILKRRRLPLVPFVGILIELVLTAMLTYGQTRYRAPFEVVLVVLSAVTIDAILTDARHRRGSHTQYARPEAQTVA